MRRLTCSCIYLKVSKSRLVSLIDWVTVVRRYVPIVWYVVLAVLVGQIAMVLFAHRQDLQVHLLMDLRNFSLPHPYMMCFVQSRNL